MSYQKARELLALAIFLAGRTGATLSDIEQEFECERRRAQRMIAALYLLFPQLSRKLDEERRPRWSLPASSLAPFVLPSSDELAALVHAKQALAEGPAKPEMRHLQNLEAKIRAMVPAQLRNRLAVDEEALLECMGLATRPGPRPAANADVDELIGFSLKARQRLRILYASGGDASPRWRTIEPYGLLLGARRYLVAVDAAKRGKCRYYRVDSIHAAKLGEGHFEVDSSFDLATQAKKGFGTYERESEYGEVVWRFSPAAAAHAQKFQFHPDQEAEFEEDGSLIIRFFASGYIEMAWHLYMWGDRVEVLAPRTLREMVKDYRRSDFEALP